VADRKLATLGIDVDDVTDTQEAYASDWRHTDSSF
jgi:S-adenosylhomocysteine hydrolase